MSDYSTNNDFENILERLLANIDDSLDKTQGSIIYDALAPAAAELAQCYIALDVYSDQTYLLIPMVINHLYIDFQPNQQFRIHLYIHQFLILQLFYKHIHHVHLVY